jgi:hypothetical protein
VSVLSGRDVIRGLREYAWVVAGALPVVLYDGYLAFTDPRLTEGQALYASPSPLLYLLGFGIVGFLALAGAGATLRRRDLPGLFLLAWILVTMVQIYVPLSLIPFQMQLVLGIRLPLAILATQTLVVAHAALDGTEFANWAKTGLRGCALALVLSLAGVTSAYHVANAVGSLREGDLPEYLNRDLEAGMLWLERHTAEDSVVLSSPEAAPYIPVLANNRVYMGDYAAPTADYAGKQRKVRAALGPGPVPVGLMERFVREERIAYVFWDRGLRRLGGAAAWRRLEESDTLTRVFRNPAVSIYRVEGAR